MWKDHPRVGHGRQQLLRQGTANMLLVTEARIHEVGASIAAAGRHWYALAMRSRWNTMK